MLPWAVLVDPAHPDLAELLEGTPWICPPLLVAVLGPFFATNASQVGKFLVLLLLMRQLDPLALAPDR